MAIAAKIRPVVPTPRPYASRHAAFVILPVCRRNCCDEWDSAPPQVVPPLQQALRDLLGVQREAQVVPPVAVDVQIARPQSLRPKPELGHHPQAADVLGPNRD